jgi:hypothetical protein
MSIIVREIKPEDVEGAAEVLKSAGIGDAAAE